MLSEPESIDPLTTTTNMDIPTALLPRHSGRVYVRGRIRRIWRPRFIELMDNGTLRYYEETSVGVTPPPPQQSSTSHSSLHPGDDDDNDNNKNNNNNINTTKHDYKYTLLVNGARILDVTTIRDLHTGLPRGTYGFVLRGQRQAAHPVPLPPSSTTTTTIVPSTSANEPITTTNRPDILTDSFVFAEDEEEVVESTGTHGGSSIGAAAVSEVTTTTSNVTVPIRDYLCAVSTLEEAQMWVVALQWAASLSNLQHDDNDLHQPVTAGTAPNLPLLPVVVDQHWWNVDYTNTKRTSTTPSASLKQNVETTARLTGNKDEVEKDSSDEPPVIPDPFVRHQAVDTIVVTQEDSQATRPHKDDTKNETNMNGKVLITAVTGYSVVRNTTWTFEIVYNIHAMLLCSNSTSEENVPLAQKQRYADQWSLQRTAGQFQAVANILFCNSNDAGSNQKGIQTNIDDDECDTNSNSDIRVLGQLPTWSSRPTIAEVDQALPVLDSILRGWILSPHIINTNTFKQFLGLENMDSKQSKSSSGNDPIETALFQSLFRNVHVANPFSICNRSTTTVPNHVSSDMYVREWLQSVRRIGIQRRATSDSNKNTTTIGLCWLLFKNKHSISDVSQVAIQLHHHQYHERNMLYFGGAAAAMFGIIPTVLPLWKYIMPVIKIRLDYLLASWAGATYLGHRIASASASSNPSKSIRTERGSSSNNQRHGVPVSSRNDKLGTTAQSSSSSLKSIATNPVVQQQAQQMPDSPKAVSSSDNSVVMVTDYVDAVHSSDLDDFADFVPPTTGNYYHRQQNETNDIHDDYESDGEATTLTVDNFMQRPATSLDFMSSISNDNIGRNNDDYLSSPLPKYPNNNGSSCWSQPNHNIFHVRGATYLRDKVKVCSGPSPLTCRGVDVWITDNPERHIARHPSILGGRLNEADTFLVNFLLPFGNMVAYFEVPPLSSFPSKLRTVWTKFLKGDQQYRDARLKLLPVVVDGPWIVKTAVGPGKSPALLGKAIPLQYFFRDPDGRNKKGIYEIDVIITASTIAKGILSVVKSQTKTVSIAFAFIIEAAEQSELPETVLCSFQVHSLHLEECPCLPQYNFD